MRFFLIFLIAFMPLAASGQTPKTYRDGNRGDVTLPQGDISFADVVVLQDLAGSTPKASAIDPTDALGIPNYSGNTSDGSFVTLGCGGVLEMQFTDNALVDLPGPDLYIFEVGPDVEGISLAISVDGVSWTEVGMVEGGRAEVDISAVALPDTSYRFVRLTDDAITCHGAFPGADIDAVAAIGSALRFTLDGAVLFAVDSAALKPEALDALTALAGEIADAGISRFDVIGHTDSTGDAAYNATLSEQRANAVAEFFLTQPALSSAEVAARGAGEAEPVASNDTDAGRAANRRVEIIAASGG